MLCAVIDVSLNVVSLNCSLHREIEKTHLSGLDLSIDSAIYLCSA